MSKDKVAKLGGEQFVDMRQRYGGYGGLPSSLLVARNTAGDVVGCAGIEMALLDGQKIIPKSIESLARGLDVMPLISNVAIAPACRKQGLGKALCLE